MKLTEITDKTEGTGFSVNIETETLDEIGSFKKKDYVRCPDGQRHDWIWAGGNTIERKTNRIVNDRKCSNCGLVKQIFHDTGKRLNR